jgi:hypothetical protein
MAFSPTPIRFDPRYDDFLQSHVGDDRRGTSVTVLSMLARLGIDPWREAYDLAAMQDGFACQKLDVLLSDFADIPVWVPSRNEVALRLAAKLPRRVSSRSSILDDRNEQYLRKILSSPLYVAVFIVPILAYYVLRIFGN